MVGNVASRGSRGFKEKKKDREGRRKGVSAPTAPENRGGVGDDRKQG